LIIVGLTACGDLARLPVAAGTGPNPTLPAPTQSLIPTVNIAPAQPWSEQGSPTPAPGMIVRRFAQNLDHPRWLYVLPNGDVLVAETNAPVRPENSTGLRGWITKQVMKRAGAGVRSANRITLLRDSDGDGIADQRFTFLQGLNSPFGMALIGSDFYVADTDAVLRFAYRDGQTEIISSGTKVIDLPAGPINHHWTKNILPSPDGTKLYITVGSNSNAGENGMQNEVDRAAIWELDLKTGAHRVFASGLRNPNGMAWEPHSGALWTVVNERDELGSDLVPDYLTSVKDGGFYGWPYSYFGQHIDPRLKPQRPELVKQAIVPDYALGPHTASLGLAFAQSPDLPAPFVRGMFIGQHGSWNRKPRSGYKVVFVAFDGAEPTGPLLDVLTGFVGDDGKAHGRPVGVAIDKRDALLVADDVGNVIWRVTRARDAVK